MDLVVTSAPATTTAQSTDDRSTSFRPVEGGNELQSGEKLLVEAYAAIWIILFAMVLLSWRRQKSLDDRMGALSAAIDKARRKERGEGEG
jgi:CcmD family protein